MVPGEGIKSSREDSGRKTTLLDILAENLQELALDLAWVRVSTTLGTGMGEGL